MGIIIAICINWFAAGVCFGVGLASFFQKMYGLVALNVALLAMNVCLGVINVNRLIAAVQFVAETAK